MPQDNSSLTPEVSPLSVTKLGQQCGRTIDRSDLPRFPVTRQSSTIRSCNFANGSATGSNNTVSEGRADDGAVPSTSTGAGAARKSVAVGPSTRIGCIGMGGDGQIPRTKMTTRCLWNACKALSIGLVLLALGCVMATLGYYADQLSETKQMRGNTTVQVKDEWTGFHLNNLSYAGPIVMGVGGFIIVAACVMTFEARDSAAKVVPARFRLQRPRSPIRRKNVTPAGLQAPGSGSRKSAASQTRWSDSNEIPEVPPKHGKPCVTQSPRRQSHEVSKLSRVPSGPHQNHQQLLQLLARRRREELTSDLTNFSKQPLGVPHAPLKRCPSAPSALHRLHRLPHPPRPPDALLPSLPPVHPQENSHTKVTRTWSRGSRKHSPLSGGRRQHPVLRRQALSVDQATVAAARTPYGGHDYPHHGNHDGGEEGSQSSIAQPSHRRTATVVCHHESYSPLIGYGSGGDEVRDEVKEEEKEGLLKSNKLESSASMDSSTRIETAIIEISSRESPLLGAVGGVSELTDLEAIEVIPEETPEVFPEAISEAFPEVIPEIISDLNPEVRVRPMLGQRARSETARRHQLTRQKQVTGDGNG